jgi:hypothetical protein
MAVPYPRKFPRRTALRIPLSLRRKVATWRHAARAVPTHVVAICGVFGALIFAGVYAANKHTALFGSSRASNAGGLAGAAAQGGGGSAGAVTGAAELSPADPVMRFSDTGVGQVLFMSPSGETCQRVLFDNRAGSFFTARKIFCGQKLERVVETDSPDRLTSVRQSFQR